MSICDNCKNIFDDILKSSKAKKNLFETYKFETYKTCCLGQIDPFYQKGVISDIFFYINDEEVQIDFLNSHLFLFKTEDYIDFPFKITSLNQFLSYYERIMKLQHFSL